MAWTTPRTWVALELVTAAYMNAQVRDNSNVLATSIDTASGKISGNIKNFYEDVNALGNSGTTLPTVDLNLGNNVSFTHTGNIAGAPTLNNIPASGKFCSLTWIITFNGSIFTWAWLTGTVVWDGASAPTFAGTLNHVMFVMTWTTNNGTTWRGLQLASNYAS